MFAVLLDLLLRPFTKTHSILKDIGSGSFGTVLLTRNKLDNELYVAKFIKTKKVKELVPDSTVGEDVPLEIYILSRLSHPNIVNCVGCYKLPQHWVLTMNYLENFVDLKTLIKLHRRLSEPMSRTVLTQTYDALVYCLSVGVDHRDVKHQNILVHQSTLRVKLIDFGLSSICDSKTVYTSVQGTELFLPPEAIVQRHYTPLESTSWSLGCLLYCMVVGHAPFSSRRDVVFSEPDLPPSLSPYCVDLISSCLHKVRHLRVRFENIRWHTWLNLDRYRKFLASSAGTFNNGTVNRGSHGVSGVSGVQYSQTQSVSSYCSPSSTLSYTDPRYVHSTKPPSVSYAFLPAPS